MKYHELLEKHRKFVWKTWANPNVAMMLLPINEKLSAEAQTGVSIKHPKYSISQTATMKGKMQVVECPTGVNPYTQIDLLHAVLGLAGEVLEYQEADLQLYSALGTTESLVVARDKEIGDVHYYICQTMNVLGVPMISKEQLDACFTQTDNFEFILSNMIDVTKRIVFYQQGSTDLHPKLRGLCVQFYADFIASAELSESEISKIVQQNIDKLTARYPDLMFKTTDSIERKDECQG